MAFTVFGIAFKSGPQINTFTGTINTSTTWAGTYKANPSSLLLNLTAKKLYINTGTKASPTWTVVGAQS
jgi:hypothetical protein